MSVFSLLAIPTQLGLAALAGAIAPRAVAWIPVGLVLLLPWLIPPSQLTHRAFAGLTSVALLMRATDLLRERPPRTLAVRIVHALSIVDLRLLVRVPPRIDLALAFGGTWRMLLGIAGLWLANTFPPAAQVGGLAGRWAVGAAAFYAAFEGFDQTIRAVYLVCGAQAEPTQRSPIMSRTLAEFWGRRWNAIVHRWLASVAFAPVARRNPALGTFFAFVLSAAIHAMITGPALGGRATMWMAGFFILHGALVLVERKLRVSRWHRPWARVWTLGWLILTAPLFLEPFLGLFGGATLLDAPPAGA